MSDFVVIPDVVSRKPVVIYDAKGKPYGRPIGFGNGKGMRKNG